MCIRSSRDKSSFCSFKYAYGMEQWNSCIKANVKYLSREQNGVRYFSFQNFIKFCKNLESYTPTIMFCDIRYQ